MCTARFTRQSIDIDFCGQQKDKSRYSDKQSTKQETLSDHSDGLSNHSDSLDMKTKIRKSKNSN